MTDNSVSNREWIVEDWIEAHQKLMDTSVEGSFKTFLGLSLCVHIASGTPFLGQSVKQGNVLIIDEEMGENLTTMRLQRLALGIGCKDWQELPIKLYSMHGFRFDRKTSMEELLTVAIKFNPVVIRMDSLLAMIPGGRQGLCENDSNLGIVVRDALNTLLKTTSLVFVAAHSKKEVDNWSLLQLHEKQMQTIVRGHGSIVGEACDTGLVLKKISESPKPTRFLIITKVRRSPSPLGKEDIYVELKEQEYGSGWIRLERISPEALPPSSVAKELFILFYKNPDKTFSQQKIRQEAALYTLSEIREGINDLMLHRVILNTQEAFTYHLNPDFESDSDSNYLNELSGQNTILKVPHA